jgi:hypothetical protein
LSLPDPNARLIRDEAAAALRAAGYHFSSATLATRAYKRTGPPVEMFSGRPVYTWASTLAWAQADAESKASKRRPVSDRVAA